MLILKADIKNSIKIFEKATYNNQPVIFPTDTIYGVGAFIDDIKSNKKIYEIKGREENKPFPILISSFKQLDLLIDQKLDAEKTKILENIWPGVFTVIFKAKTNISELFTLNGNIAVRFININWLSNLISHFDMPLSATSANLSGYQYDNDVNKIILNFQKGINYFLFSDVKNTIPSTILDFTSEKIKFIRNPNNLKINDLII
jgi:L-threonylcarbamoyladenylate synthase